MKYFFIVGEPSGDMHAANLIAELKKSDTQFSGKGLGGEKMQQQNIEIVCGLERLSFMGFWEVLKNLGTIRRNFKLAKKSILDYKPDVVILIDYPGFNLRMAKWCKTNGFKVAYYILPQVWAWKENRIRQLKKYCDRLIGVLPFEKEFYEQRGVDMEFVGHPLLDQISTISAPLKGQFLAMLPGSRKQEITRLMPILMELANSFPDEQFVIAALKKMQKFYPKELPVNVRIEWDNTYFVLQKSKAALVCSGTATLETTLLNVPQIVVYITNFVNYQIGKRLAKVNFISLPNLIAGEKVVEELLQQDCTAEKIGDELKKLLKTDGSQMYTKVIQKIGGPGASAKAAKIIFELAG